MVLESRNPSTHNQALGRMTHPACSTFKPLSEPSSSSRPSKRQKTSSSEPLPSHPKPPSAEQPSHDAARNEIPDSEAESGEEEFLDAEQPTAYRTDLEQSVPAVKTDKEAIQEYEAMRSAGELRDRLGKGAWAPGKSSIYVDAFNVALETVLEEEGHLFDEAEMRVFEEWRALEYEAQYLYVRIFLRKTSAWHRINRLRYYDNIADLQGACHELFRKRSLPEGSTEVQIAPGELEPPKGTTLKDSFTFADCSDDWIDSLEEASSLLLLDELKAIAKEAKVQGKNKTELLRSFRRTSGQQTGIDFVGLKRSDTEESGQSRASESREESPQKSEIPGGNRDAHFVRKIMAETGQCIRVSLATLRLFERVHLVFYRSSEWTEKSLTTIILARIARRNFPEYVVSRSANVFPSRSMLLEFEAALRAQFRVDSILEFNGYPTKETLQIVLDIFEEVYPRWKILLTEEQQKEDSIYASGEGAYLRRLSPAWVYTRIVHKAAGVLGLGRFNQHGREHELLTELLDQRLFHSSRRGAWYQRKALLEEHYMADLKPSEDRNPEEQKKHWKRIALRTCEEGLEDNLVQVVHHYDLQKRLVKLEKALKIAKRLQHEFGHARLAKPIETTFEGIRIERPAKTSAAPALPSSTSTRKSSVSDAAPSRRGAKTVWIDPADSTSECSVEEMCLSHYRAAGWKGFHTEGGVLRTLFALLFYDVLFTYVPNVFQTPFQTCPLDLHTDAFYPARMSEVNARLAQIANGGAEELVREVWAREEERKTCVVGLDWGFELEDLCAIVRCFGGEELATVCKVMAQEYAERTGGVPDLFLWHEGEGRVCFAEVKSENDRLSDTQRLWIHVLAGAGIRVELCNAVAKEVRVP